MIKREPILELEELRLTSAARGFLREISKWTYFLAILGFIGLGLMVFFSFFAGTLFASYPNIVELPVNLGSVVIVINIIISVIYFFPINYLMQFSRKLKTALETKNDETLVLAFEKLKSHYKFIGVFAIIVISIYVLIFLFSIFAASAF